jgi:dTDP-4-amino-4,6-dideoxygalactose transaminase
MSDIAIADPRLGPAAKDNVAQVLESGQLADGPTVRAFEDDFADFCGVHNAVATANGTAALHAALHAVGVDEGDAVVTTPFSFVASANAIRFCGARPVFADVDPETFTLDPDAVAEALETTEDAAAVLPVHLYGLPADVEELATVCDRHGVALVEDAAQAHGAAYEDRPVGSFGAAAAFSFYPTKNMTTGEGGIVLSDDPVVAERAARFVDHGRAPVDDGNAYRHVEVGYNYRLSSVAAAIGLAQLERLPENNHRRRVNARALDEVLAPIPAVETPTEPDGRRHVYHQYTIRADDRDGLRNYLAEAGIGTGVYYPRPIHEQPAYDDVEASTPVAERAADEVLSLPVHPELTGDDVDRVANAVGEFYGYD